MSSFRVKKNYDAVTERNILVGFINYMDGKLKYTNRFTNKTKEESVPFIFGVSESMDERYIQDEISKKDMQRFVESECPNLAKWDYDKLPHGYIRYAGSSTISDNELTNPYVRAKYQKENEHGQLQDYFAFFRSIPVSLEFDVVIKVDSFNTSMKISEAIKKTLYKNRQYHIMNEGLRIPCLLNFPESQGIDKQVTFTSEDEKIYKIEFSVECSSYLYDFVFDTEIFAGKRMATLVNNTKIDSDEIDPSIQVDNL